MLTQPGSLVSPELELAVLEAVCRFVEQTPGSFAQRELAALELLQRAGQVALQEDLQRMSDALPDAILVGPERRLYRTHQPGKATYPSLNGELSVERSTYREVGVRNGPTIVPLELMAGVIEGATPAFAENVAEGYGMRDMREHGRALESARRYAPPRATLERLAVRLATRVEEAVPELEPLVRACEAIPEGTRAISVGLDRTTTPMAEPRPADAPRKPRRTRKKPRVRRAPEPIDVKYRMAYVGTVALVDEDGVALSVLRYAVPAETDAAKVCARMAADVQAALRKKPGLPVVLVQDAAPEMWNLTRDALRPLRRPGELVHYFEAVDLMHAMQHLSAALNALGVDPVASQAQRAIWHRELLERDSAIDAIEADLKSRAATVHGAAKEALDAELTYLANNKDRMRYAGLARRGLPVGSGTTESAAKTVINERTCGAGQRWKDPGLRGVLTLRSIAYSNRLPQFWLHFSRTYVTNINCEPPRLRRAS